MGTPDEAAEFCGQRAPGMRCLSDPGQRAYRAYGLGRAGARELLAPGVALGGVRAVLEGHAPGVPVGDPRQLPGTFVIRPDGRVQLAYYSRSVADHAPAALILEALDQARGGRGR